MSVTIRLTRAGSKKVPFYRVVAADSRSPRDGRFIEQLGVYDPAARPAEFRVDEDRIQHWISVGALPSQTVGELLRGLKKSAPPRPPRRSRPDPSAHVHRAMSDDLGRNPGEGRGSEPSLRELIDYLARGLVDHPEEVEVEEVEEPDALVFELKVAEEDLGKVIGKQGRTAKALRTILSAASAKTRRRVILEILE